MTCAHVLDVIDAGPFADLPASTLDAAARHVADCPACDHAWRASRHIVEGLRGLPQSEAPGDIKPLIMARLAAVEPLHGDCSFVSGAGAGRGRVPDWRRAAALAAVALGVAVVMVLSAVPSDGLRVRNGLDLADLRAWPPGAFALACAVALYLTGLFAPLRQRRA